MANGSNLAGGPAGQLSRPTARRRPVKPTPTVTPVGGPTDLVNLAKKEATAKKMPMPKVVGGPTDLVKKPIPRGVARRAVRGFKNGGTYTRKKKETGSAARKARRQILVNKSNNMKVFKDVMNEQRKRG